MHTSVRIYMCMHVCCLKSNLGEHIKESGYEQESYSLGYRKNLALISHGFKMSRLVDISHCTILCLWAFYTTSSNLKALFQHVLFIPVCFKSLPGFPVGTFSMRLAVSQNSSMYQAPETCFTLLFSFQIFKIANLRPTIMVLFIIFFGYDLFGEKL